MDTCLNLQQTNSQDVTKLQGAQALSLRQLIETDGFLYPLQIRVNNRSQCTRVNVFIDTI